MIQTKDAKRGEAVTEGPEKEAGKTKLAQQTHAEKVAERKVRLEEQVEEETRKLETSGEGPEKQARDQT